MLKILLPIVVLLIGAVGAYAIVVNRPALEAQPAKPEPPLVSVVRAEPQTVRFNVRSQGVVTPRTEIDWVAEVAGKVIRLNPDFVAGGFFEAGEELVALDPRDYDQAVVAAEAKLAEARRRLAQEEAEAEQARSEWEALGEGEPTPLARHEPQLAEARAKLKAAEAELIKARLDRSRCELHAPFAGRVLARYVGLGQYVQPGEKLARLQATDVAEVRLPVSTEQLADLDVNLGRRKGADQSGSKVRMMATVGGIEQHWEGRIVRSEAQIDDTTGLLHLVAEVPDPYGPRHAQLLLSGLFVQAEIEGRERSGVFVLPLAAVNAAQEALVVDSEHRLHIRRLKVLRTEADRVLVAEGLAAGEAVVIDGVSVPVEGMHVRLEAGDAKPEESDVSAAN
ncbi:efflux RND transporter periplasmic adaptor subunit [Methylocaldum szegediense]|uniref:RND family efflux transporter MFP subunit n=1 Tax=Methylocaldum szegediense TaxID=73780 RepID=A0ABM9I2U3_9GAMM|nr:efflux RND transporter periplasmic adaptor subunit [Methylocaldum szegediense]CAI8853987.1 RND family efflux transporter MFP subunit [Methylocaldum szegediense]